MDEPRTSWMTHWTLQLAAGMRWCVRLCLLLLAVSVPLAVILALYVYIFNHEMRVTVSLFGLVAVWSVLCVLLGFTAATRSRSGLPMLPSFNAAMLARFLKTGNPERQKGENDPSVEAPAPMSNFRL